MLSLSCHFLNKRFRASAVSLCTAVLLFSSAITMAAPKRCDRSAMFAFSQAVYGSEFERAGTYISAIRSDKGPEMADFLQQVLNFTQAYETGKAAEQVTALEEVDAQISRLQLRLEKDSGLQLKLDAGNIMMNAARMHLLSRNVMRSAQLAKAAYRLLDEVLEVSPQQADAYLSVGLYLYFSANENNAWGWIKRLLALEGDKDKGREMIERAVMASPDFSFEAARSLMMDLNWDYPAICRYVAVFDSLDAPQLKTIEHRQRSIAAHFFCGQPAQGEDEIKEVSSALQSNDIKVNEVQSQWLFEAHLNALAMQGRAEELTEMLVAEAAENSERAMMIRFSLARALDVQGRREQAIVMYSRLANSSLAERYRNLAAAYRKLAYRPPARYPLAEKEALVFACSE